MDQNWENDKSRKRGVMVWEKEITRGSVVVETMEKKIDGWDMTNGIGSKKEAVTEEKEL